MSQMAARAALICLGAGAAIMGCAQLDSGLNRWRDSGAPQTRTGIPGEIRPDSGQQKGGIAPGAVLTEEAKRVLVIANQNDRGSVDIAKAYANQRALRPAQILLVKTTSSEEIPYENYKAEIEAPLRQALAKANPPVDFVVLTRGIPIRLNHANGNSVDSTIVAMDLPRGQGEGPEGMAERLPNPYFGATQPFSAKRTKMLLVTRLDGYTVQDVMALMARAKDALPAKGPFLLDEAANRSGGGYLAMQRLLGQTAQGLESAGFQTILDRTAAFQAPTARLMGYVSWGSNDDAFDQEKFRSLKFQPGAIGETFVSTSGRTFRPTTGGQSLVADLIAAGITGVKGYVAEPYTIALANPVILFRSYTRGMNLAESFYAASPVVRWKDVVIGDPLCRPYGRR